VCEQKLGVLRQHCADVGRDVDSLVRSTNMNLVLIEPGADPVQASAPYRGEASFEDFTENTFVMTPEEVVEHVRKLGDLGINYVITYFARVAMDQSMMQNFAENVIPAFA
jgi:hypothetical protein